MTQVLIDTDVVLDFFFDRQVMYYLLRQTATHEKVIEKLKLLSSITSILMMDNNVVFRALNSDFKDFEDALQNYSAELNNNFHVISLPYIFVLNINN